MGVLVVHLSSWSPSKLKQEDYPELRAGWAIGGLCLKKIKAVTKDNDFTSPRVYHQQIVQQGEVGPQESTPIQI